MALQRSATGKLVVAHKRRRPAEEEQAIAEFLRRWDDIAASTAREIQREIAAGDFRPATVDIRSAVARRFDVVADELEAAFEESALDALEAGRAAANRRFDLEIAADVFPDQLRDEIQAFADDIAESSIDILVDDLGRKIETWHEDGLGVEEIANRLQEFNSENIEAFRAEERARTLMNGSSNRGHDSAIQESDAVGEEWITTLDGRERETHSDANGQIVRADMTFLVGGVEMRHPGDPVCSPEEVANCRCTIAAVWADDLTDDERERLEAGERLNV